MGWDQDKLKIMIIGQSSQALFCLVESMVNNEKFYCTIVYAETIGKKRRILWKELMKQNWL